MKNLNTTLFVLFSTAALAFMAANCQAQTQIYSDDFTTDPFVDRWTKTSSADYGLYWTGSFTPFNSLPAEVGNPLDALYTFSIGTKEAWTTDTTENIHSQYSASIDFIMNGTTSVSDNGFGMYLQRQDDDAAYRASFSLGGNGMVTWTGCYGFTGYDVEPLAANVWYKLITEVTVNESAVSLQSRIVRISDGTVMRTSPTFTDTSEQRYTSSKGYGIVFTLPGSHYWNQALQVDNVVVESSQPQRFCGDSDTFYYPGDITGPKGMGIKDCRVNEYDLQEFAANWLKCSDPADPCNCNTDPYPWLGNNLGKLNIVPDPWTAITVTAPNTVNIWGRSYTFNSIGLPSSIIAAGQELLAEPARLVTVVNGLPVNFTPAGSLIINHSDTVTTVKGNAFAGNLQLEILTTVEFDGFARVDLILVDPTGTATLNQFHLEFPITADNALFHLPLFLNDPAIPSGGISRPVVGSSDWTNFTTSSLWWVGGDDRGFTLAAEDDRGWCSEDRDAAQQLDTATAGQVIWRYRFIDSSVTRSMAVPLELTYCFMATPVKPVDNWYNQRVSGNCGYGVDPGQPAAVGIEHGHIHEPWTEIMGYPGTFEHIEELKTYLDNFNAAGVGTCLYSHPVISSAAPEWEDWINQWCSSYPPRAGFTRDPSFGGMKQQSVYGVHQSESWADFYVYNWVKMIRQYGANGVFLDGTFSPVVTTNPNFDHAYIAGDEVLPTRAIFAARDFMKRWYIACKMENPNFYFLAHMSGGGFFMPTASFVDYCMGGEQLGVGPAPDTVSWNYMRASQTGRQFGLVREFYCTAKLQEPYMIPIALVHGINVWAADCGGGGTQAYQLPTWNMWDSFGVNDADWHPYWENSELVTSSNTDVKVSFYTKPQQVLLVAGTNLREKPNANITVDLIGLGLDPGNLSATFGSGTSVDLMPYMFGTIVSLPFPELLDRNGLSNYLWIRSDL